VYLGEGCLIAYNLSPVKVGHFERHNASPGFFSMTPDEYLPDGPHRKKKLKLKFRAGLYAWHQLCWSLITSLPTSGEVCATYPQQEDDPKERVAHMLFSYDIILGWCCFSFACIHCFVSDSNYHQAVCLNSPHRVYKVLNLTGSQKQKLYACFFLGLGSLQIWMFPTWQLEVGR